MSEENQEPQKKHPKWPIDPIYKTDTKYSRSQVITFCNYCGDTSFELLEDLKPTGKCCRCGKKY